MAVNIGVLHLASLHNDKMRLVIEDNIGESIHIHYNNIRLDFTIDDFMKFSEGLLLARSKLIKSLGAAESRSIPIDKKFAEKLMENNFNFYAYEEVDLSDLIFTNLINGERVALGIKDSIIYKSISTNNRAMYEEYISKVAMHTGEGAHYSWESFLHLLKSIKDYQYKEDCLVVVREIISEVKKMQVMDGQHRVAILYYLFGNIKIKVAKYHIEN